jgi:hypothetical protein
MSDGWAVKVTRMTTTGRGTQTELWYASIADRTEAEKAVRKRVSAPADTLVVAEQTVSEAALKGMGLNEGQVGQRA